LDSKRHLNHIETMRALAALSVAVFHFTNYSAGNYFLIDSESVRKPFEFGAQGVEMFYIISGFIIPYALDTSNFRLQHFGGYLWKRFLRIFPPFVATIVLMELVRLYLVKFHWGGGFDVEWKRIAANLLFLSDSLPQYEWLNPIFRTLKVEIQYYLVIGLLFPLIRLNQYAGMLLLTAFAGSAWFFIGSQNVFSNAPFFVLGISAYFIFRDGLKWPYALCICVSLFLLAYWYYWEDVIIGSIAVALIFLIPSKTKFLTYTGKVSYSFYLSHGIFGGWFLYAMSGESYSLTGAILLVILALLISWAGAFLGYHLIEKHCITLAKKTGYRN